MKHILKSCIFLLLLTILGNCSSQRKAAEINPLAMESELALQMKSRADTLMTLTEFPDVTQRGEKTVKTFFTRKGVGSLCFLNSDVQMYPDTALLENLKWDWIVNAYDSIQLQQPQPAYSGWVIEQDTHWREMQPLFPTHFVVHLYLPTQVMVWETTSFEMDTNPSQLKTRIINYLLSISGRGRRKTLELFGSPEKQRQFRSLQ
jgi:hypothetical protein